MWVLRSSYRAAALPHLHSQGRRNGGALRGQCPPVLSLGGATREEAPFYKSKLIAATREPRILRMVFYNFRIIFEVNIVAEKKQA